MLDRRKLGFQLRKRNLEWRATPTRHSLPSPIPLVSLDTCARAGVLPARSPLAGGSRFNKAPVRNAKHVRAKVLPTERARNDVPRPRKRKNGREEGRKDGWKKVRRAVTRRIKEGGVSFRCPVTLPFFPLVLERTSRGRGKRSAAEFSSREIIPI